MWPTTPATRIITVIIIHIIITGIGLTITHIIITGIVLTITHIITGIVLTIILTEHLFIREDMVAFTITVGSTTMVGTINVVASVVMVVVVGIDYLSRLVTTTYAGKKKQ